MNPYLRKNLRRHYAGQALQGIIAAHLDGPMPLPEHAAKQAFDFADAMLAEEDRRTAAQSDPVMDDPAMQPAPLHGQQQSDEADQAVTVKGGGL